MNHNLIFKYLLYSAKDPSFYSIWIYHRLPEKKVYVLLIFGSQHSSHFYRHFRPLVVHLWEVRVGSSPKSSFNESLPVNLSSHICRIKTENDLLQPQWSKGLMNTDTGGEQPHLTKETVIFLLFSVLFNMYRVPLLSQSLVNFFWESAGFPSSPESPWKENPLLVCTEPPTWWEAGQDLNAKFSPDCSPSTLSLPYKSLSF